MICDECGAMSSDDDVCDECGTMILPYEMRDAGWEQAFVASPPAEEEEAATPGGAATP